MIIKKNGDLIIVKIFRDNLDVYDVDKISEWFRELFTVIGKKYDIGGLCDVDVYTNDKYGMIVEIENVFYYDEMVDVKISFHLDTCFLSEVDFDGWDKMENLYYYDGKYYTNFDFGYDGDVIYKNSLEIIDKGIKIR